MVAGVGGEPVFLKVLGPANSTLEFNIPMNVPTALCIWAVQAEPSELFKRNRGCDVGRRLMSKDWIWEEMGVNNIEIHCMYKALD